MIECDKCGTEIHGRSFYRPVMVHPIDAGTKTPRITMPRKTLCKHCYKARDNTDPARATPMIESTAAALGEHVLLGTPTDADKLARVRAYCEGEIASFDESYPDGEPYGRNCTEWADLALVETCRNILAILDEATP